MQVYNEILIDKKRELDDNDVQGPISEKQGGIPIEDAEGDIAEFLSDTGYYTVEFLGEKNMMFKLAKEYTISRKNGI